MDFFLFVLERGEAEGEKKILVIYAFIGWFLFVCALRIKPKTFPYREVALNNRNL